MMEATSAHNKVLMRDQIGIDPHLTDDQLGMIY